MTIAIHIPAGENDLPDSFHFTCFSRIAALQPNHHFLFIFDSRPSPEIYLEPNCTPVILLQRFQNNLSRHYWYNFIIPPVLERYQADVFVTAKGFCSLRTRLPQCLLLDPAFKWSPRGSYSKKYLPLYAQKADAVCVTNPVTEKILLQFQTSLAGKIITMYPGLDLFPADESIKNSIKEDMTSGQEYFLFEISAGSDALKVLKAFSLFKKWQKSAMKLILMLPGPQPALVKLLHSYKYASDIIMYDGVNPAVPQSAYTAINFNLPGNYPLAALSYLKAGIPVITNDHPSNRLIFSEAPVYSDFTEQDLSTKMILLYKDEFVRAAHIREGKLQTASYDWKLATGQLWKVLSGMAK